MNIKTYKDNFVNFTIKCFEKEKDDFKRSHIYYESIKTKEIEILQDIAHYFSNEPDTGCRKIILKVLCEIAYVDKSIVDEIQDISEGKGRRHGDYSLIIEPTSWQSHLIDYLECVKNNNKIDFKYKEKLLKIKDFLKEKNLFNYRSEQEYFNFFNIYQKKRNKKCR
jgi:hypothetical protein